MRPVQHSMPNSTPKPLLEDVVKTGQRRLHYVQSENFCLITDRNQFYTPRCYERLLIQQDIFLSFVLDFKKNTCVYICIRVYTCGCAETRKERVLSDLMELELQCANSTVSHKCGCEVLAKVLNHTAISLIPYFCFSKNIVPVYLAILSKRSGYLVSLCIWVGMISFS